MKYWEFLIQKEGDDTWLPLETQQVEILEGRYRVVAHTDRLNTPMEIKVSQLDTSQVPPRKRMRQRTGETNEAGLVVVMPYVHLKPGQWDLACCSVSPTSGVAGQAWQYQVQLQVFSPTDEDWSSEWPVPEDASNVQSALIESNGLTASDTAVPPLNQDTPLRQAQARLKDNLQRQGQAKPEDPAALNSIYQVSLRQQAFLARRNQSMTIMGQVQALSDALPSQGASQLWLRLQNPETAKVIMEAHRPLSLERLPADFKVKIQLPVNVKTRVVLGEVSLRSAPVEGEPSTLLASAGFTITAGIAQLIDEIANRDPGTFAEEMAALSGQGDSLIEQRVHPEPDLISPILDPTRQTVMPAVGVVLPPQINQDLLASNGAASAVSANLPDTPEREQSELPPELPPELPRFPQSQQQHPEQIRPPLSISDASPARVEQAFPEQEFPRRQSLVAQPAQFMGTSIEDDDIEASQIAALLEDIDGDLASQPAEIESLEPPGVEGVLESVPETSIPLPDAGLNSTAPRNQDRASANGRNHDTSDGLSNGLNRRSQPATQNAPTEEKNEQAQRQRAVNEAFKSLKLKDHFWQRLSNLTHESREEAAQLADNMEAAGVRSHSEQPTDARSLPPFPENRQNSLPANSEVVIYDQPLSVQKTDLPATQQPDLAQASSDVPVAQDIPLTPTHTGNTPIATPMKPQSVSSSFGQPSLGQSQVPSRQVPSQQVPSQRNQPQPIQPSGPVGDLPEMELPVISVPRGDFVAGDTVTITVRARPSVYKPFIKLWMIDRQSRTLVGDPKLLTNLKADALGYLEASVDLQVPMGCLDVQIAAIAVDMATQQESNKAIVNRHVVPTNQSLPPLRKFNL